MNEHLYLKQKYIFILQRKRCFGVRQLIVMSLSTKDKKNSFFLAQAHKCLMSSIIYLESVSQSTKPKNRIAIIVEIKIELFFFAVNAN